MGYYLAPEVAFLLVVPTCLTRPVSVANRSFVTDRENVANLAALVVTRCVVKWVVSLLNSRGVWVEMMSMCMGLVGAVAVPLVPDLPRVPINPLTVLVQIRVWVRGLVILTKVGRVVVL